MREHLRVLPLVACCLVFGRVASISISVAESGAQCESAAKAQTKQPTHFHSRPGIALATGDVFFSPSCDKYASAASNLGSAFHHPTMSSADKVRVAIQVSLSDPSTARLRFSMQGLSVVLDHSGIRTSSSIPVQESREISTEPPWRKRQMQGLIFMIQKRNRLCVLTIDPYPSVSRVFPCPTRDTFHVHGDNITLHTVFLQNDNLEAARWDFTIEKQAPSVGCRECPLGTVLNATSQECQSCFTGLHVNVDARSEWWYNSDVTAEPSVPAPDWAVLLVDQTPTSSGILRYSDMQTNGNMILTDSRKPYVYDRVASVCMLRYATRVDFTECTDSPTPRVKICTGENTVLFPVVAMQGTMATVRSMLATEYWKQGDTVRFCVPLGKAVHRCVNPIVLVWHAANSWSPINVDPAHSKYTRYTITTSYADAFLLP